MKPFVLALLLTAGTAWGQGVPSPGEMARAAPPSPPPGASDEASPQPAKTKASTPNQTSLDRLAQTNEELLELLKKQQAVLEDIQYDRRLQNRQIQLVEVRLEDTLQQNAVLQAKIDRLEAEATAAPRASAPAAAPGASEKAPAAEAAPPAVPPAPPSTYLPSPGSTPPGMASFQRLLTLSGDDSKSSDIFHIQGKHWRVLWHNQDKPGDTYKNTSALFISAFPKNDNIPKKICSKLGSGGDTTDLTGAGDYYLKIEASGGHWELAVEDFR